MGYTPGPWKWWTSNSFLRLSSQATGKDGGVIDSYVMKDGHSSLIVSKEDMNLIAAAPDLLEALQLAEKAMAEGRNVTYPEWYGVINKARAAISKALGGGGVMEINKEQASEIIKLIEQALLDGFDDEILVSLHESLTKFVSE